MLVLKGRWTAQLVRRGSAEPLPVLAEGPSKPKRERPRSGPRVPAVRRQGRHNQSDHLSPTAVADTLSKNYLCGANLHTTQGH